MLIPVLIVSSLVHVYSIGYMQHDPQYKRFAGGLFITFNKLVTAYSYWSLFLTRKEIDISFLVKFSIILCFLEGIILSFFYYCKVRRRKLGLGQNHPSQEGAGGVFYFYGPFSYFYLIKILLNLVIQLLIGKQLFHLLLYAALVMKYFIQGRNYSTISSSIDEDFYEWFVDLLIVKDRSWLNVDWIPICLNLKFICILMI